VTYIVFEGSLKALTASVFSFFLWSRQPASPLAGQPIFLLR
jgi:hypothetical protein